MRGFFNARPSLPRYNYTWDTEIVLKFLDKWTPPESLNLKQLTLKVVMLIALITGQRCQTLYSMDILCVQKTDDRFRFVIEEQIKTTKPGSTQPVLILPKFDQNVNRCIYRFLEVYLEKTELLRSENTKLFLSFQKPHNPVNKETISRWIKSVLKQAGIDSDIFKPHSTRAASTSAAAKLTVPIQSIMKAAVWKKDCTFRKFYQKPLNVEDEFALAILNKK